MQENEVVGGTYLKPGTLKKPVLCTVDDRKRLVGKVPTATTGAGQLEGKFGKVVEIPTTISGRPFIVSLPLKAPDVQACIKMFGPVETGWVGRQFQVWDDENLNQLRIAPIA